MDKGIRVTVTGGKVNMDKGIRVTVTDLETGSSETQTIWDDYVIVTAGRCEVASIQTYPTSGTHVLTVKGAEGKVATR